ncbi:MAG: hypothetical protein HON23_00320 [Rickettsiales bacterium]|jgi:hypothetical protein|nr:hypothetical protein [Rickettsiales bacterium]
MKKIVLLSSVLLLSSCVSKLHWEQEDKMRAYKESNLAVEAKNPLIAIGLGVLPGGGSIYTGNYGYGAANILMWPLSIAWDPISGYNGAQQKNYEVTRARAKRLASNEVKDLEEQLSDNKILPDDYLKQKRQIEDKYLVRF